MRRIVLALALLAIGVAGWWWTAPGRATARLPPLPVRGEGPVTVAATGDALLVRPLTPDDVRAASSIVPILGSADIALTNLETNLLTREHLPETAGGVPRWPFATADAADTLRRLGINAVSVANNHTSDYGANGIIDTRRILDSRGVHHAGSGEDLQSARAPMIIGTAPRRIATIAVSASASALSRASTSWAGVNPLRYTVDVTVDPTTFDTLKNSAVAQISTAETLTMFGATIKRGPRTVVDFVADPDDQRQILDQIARARADADVVVVSLHAHEPRNDSDEPAAFIRRFARSAIDAGAALVVGHGPHRLRGVEVYGHGAILYSVGNFIFEPHGLDARALDLYDSGVDLYRMAMGAADSSGPPPAFGEAVWWEAVIARATFEHGGLTLLQLVPIDLGASLPFPQRGFPRLAVAERADSIAGRLSRLSEPFQTRMVAARGIVTVDISQGAVR